MNASIKGFTLLEILLVLSLSAIMMLYALPTSTDFIARHRVQTQVNQLLTMLQYARSEAIRTGSAVTLCKSTDGSRCNGDWSDGQLLFIDYKRNAQVSDQTHILRKFQGNPQVNIHWQGFLSNDFLRIEPHLANSAASGSFTITSSTQQYQMIINRVGRARIVGMK